MRIAFEKKKTFFLFLKWSRYCIRICPTKFFFGNVSQYPWHYFLQTSVMRWIIDTATMSNFRSASTGYT